MPARAHVKTGDIVVAITGRSKGKSGKVMKIYKDREYALVEGLNLGKKALRRSQGQPEGGIGECGAGRRESDPSSREFS